MARPKKQKPERKKKLEQPDSPGQRLRLFCQLFFPTITVFAHAMGFQKPGSLYDYFNNRKKPGGMLLDRFRELGGDPSWLRYGTGSIFANNDMGRQRIEEFKQKYPDQPLPYGEAYELPPTEQRIIEVQPSYHINNEFAAGPLDQHEAVFLLLSRTLYRLQATSSIPLNVIPLYRKLLDDIRQELDRREQQAASRAADTQSE
jgi:hypothetical protein